MPTMGVYLISVFTSVLAFTMQPMLIAINPGIDNKFMTIGWYIFASVDTGGSGNMIQAATIGMTLSLIMLPIMMVGFIKGYVDGAHEVGLVKGEGSAERVEERVAEVVEHQRRAQ